MVPLRPAILILIRDSCRATISDRVLQITWRGPAAIQMVCHVPLNSVVSLRRVASVNSIGFSRVFKKRYIRNHRDAISKPAVY